MQYFFIHFLILASPLLGHNCGLSAGYLWPSGSLSLRLLLIPRTVAAKKCITSCSAVQCSAVSCGSVQCGALQCSAVQCSTVRYSAVWFSAVWCSAVQLSAVLSKGLLLRQIFSDGRWASCRRVQHHLGYLPRPPPHIDLLQS